MKKLLQKIELKMKTVINKIVTVDRKTYHLNQVKNVFYFTSKPKILLLRQDRIGDLLISTSFIRILRNNNPNAQIDILLGKKNISAKKCIQKYVNKIFLLESNSIKYLRTLWHLNKEKYDLIIDLFDNSSTTSATIIKYANPVFALGIDKFNARIYDYTVPMLDRFNSSIVERTCNLLIAFGIEPKEQDLNLEYPVNYEQKNNTKFRVGINLAGSNERRFWGKDNNEKLIKYLFEKYENVELRLFYTSQYEKIANDFSQKFPNLLIGLCNNFDDFADEVSKCSFIISPDTSIAQLASAFKISSLIMYIFSENASHTHSPWYPYNSHFKAITTNKPTLQSIPFSEVVSTVDEILKEII